MSRMSATSESDAALMLRSSALGSWRSLSGAIRTDAGGPPVWSEGEASRIERGGEYVTPGGAVEDGADKGARWAREEEEVEGAEGERERERKRKRKTAGARRGSK